MTAILTALVCLKGMCLYEYVPTRMSFTMQECVHKGQVICAEHIGSRWRLIEYICVEGRNA